MGGAGDSCCNQAWGLKESVLRKTAKIFLVLAGVCSARERKDVLLFTNGDRITCEIMRLDKGMLYVRLPYARGEVGFDWSQIAQVESAESFVVADKRGKRYTGILQKVADGT